MEYRRLGKSHLSVPVVGLGTWGIGGQKTSDKESVEALRYGLDLGMSLIDTAEMYHGGHSEEVVGQALEGRTDLVFVASKVSPSHFRYDDVLISARKSLRRLGIKRIDLYQLHWPNPSIPISETMRAMERLIEDGSIHSIGVSNFSVVQMREAQESLSKHEIASNQVEYNLLERSIESELLPYCQKENVTVIAYSPLAQGGIPKGRGESFKVLDEIALRMGKSRNQIAISWLLQHESVITIPKAAREEHLRENAEAAHLKLSKVDGERLERVFPI